MIRRKFIAGNWKMHGSHAANAELLMNPHVPAVQMPADMLGVISAYEYGVQRRLYDIVNWVVRGNMLTGANRPAWVHDVARVAEQFGGR